MKSTTTAILFVVIFVLTACSRGPGDEELAALSPEEGGKRVFVAKCTGCHTVSGIEGGTRGPNLSKIGSQMDLETLRNFIRDPQSVKPGSRMPTLALSDRQVEAVAVFLSGFK